MSVGGCELSGTRQRPACRTCQSRIRGSRGGQGAPDNRFALGVHTIPVGIEDKAVGARDIGLNQALREVGYVADPRSAAALLNNRPRLADGMRHWKLRFSMVAVFGHALQSFSCFAPCKRPANNRLKYGWFASGAVWGEDPNCAF